MSIQLLDKTRRINNVLKSVDSDRAFFDEILKALSELILSDVFFVDRESAVISKTEGHLKKECYNSICANEKIAEEIAEWIFQINSTKENVFMEDIGRISLTATYAIAVPVQVCGKKHGVLLALRHYDPYDVEDVILTEYVANLLGVKQNDSDLMSKEEKNHVKQNIKRALDSLSASEYDAIKAVLHELDDEEGMLNVSKISQKYEITRSVIINSLRKLESAGIIENRSAGAKGTYIKIKNSVIYSEVLKESDDI